MIELILSSMIGSGLFVVVLVKFLETDNVKFINSVRLIEHKLSTLKEPVRDIVVKLIVVTGALIFTVIVYVMVMWNSFTLFVASALLSYLFPYKIFKGQLEMNEFKECFKEPQHFSGNSCVVSGDLPRDVAAQMIGNEIGETVNAEDLAPDRVRFGFAPADVEEMNGESCWYTGAGEGKGTKPVWVYYKGGK